MVYPIIYRVSTIQGGAGFLPSTYHHSGQFYRPAYMSCGSVVFFCWLTVGVAKLGIESALSLSMVPPPY